MQGKWRGGLIVAALWLTALGTAWADVRESRDAIVDNRTQTLLDALPQSGSDLPVFLPGNRDVYVLMLAGGAYTDVRVLANPGIPPQVLARALEASVPGTTLAGKTVQWSADRYAAAQIEHSSGRIGARSAVNDVPIARLTDGLRRAGFIPHILLRVGRDAEAVGLPAPVHSTRSFVWYDERALAAHPVVSVRATLPRAAPVWAACLLLLLPLIGLCALLAAYRFGQTRQRFHALTFNAILGSLVLQLPLMMVFIPSPSARALSDLWWGDSSVSGTAPLWTFGPLFMLFLVILAQFQARRRFGPDESAQAATALLSPEEKAVHQRMARWNFVPHITLAGVAIAGLIFLSPKSPLYGVLHPAAMLLPVVGGAIVSAAFRKKLAGFTQKTVNDGLTWRAHQLGRRLDVRTGNVWVEESHRASQVMEISQETGGKIVVTQKMRDDLTADEMDFLLASHIALQKHKVRGLTSLVWLFMLPLLLLPLTLIFGRRMGLSISSLILTPWFLPALFVFMLLPMPIMLLSMRRFTRQQMQRQREADRSALQATGNLAAAESALDKIAAAGQKTEDSARRLVLTQAARELPLTSPMQNVGGKQEDFG